MKANALYRELFASSPDGILLVDAETQRVIEFNDAACRQLGYTREEFFGLHVADYEASETPEETRAHVQEALREGKAEFDTLHRTKTGEIRHVHVWAKTFDLDGRAVFHAIFRDITDRKQTERALAESEAHLRQAEEKYRGIFEHALHGIYQTKPNGTFIAANTAMARILGHESAEELMAQSTDRSGWGYADPVGRAEFVRMLGRDGVVQGLEYEVLRRDGSRRWVSDNARAVRNAEGVIQYYEGTVTDITERKHTGEAEARLVAILEATPDLVSIADSEGRLVYLNRAGRTMLGMDDLADLTRYNLQEFHDAANAHVVLTEGIPTAMREGAWSGETELVALDGHAIAISQVILAHKNPDGTVAFLSTIARDITERTRVQRALQDSERLLKESQSIAGLGSYVLDIATGRWSSSAILDDIFGIDDQFGRTVDAWTKLVHADWRERMIHYLADDVVGRHRRFDMEYRIIRKSDGDARWVHGLGELEFDAHDNPIRMIGTIRDITARKEAETALRLQAAALYAAADAIVITDRAGVIEWVNPAFTQLTGYTAEEALGQNPRDLVKSDKHTAAFYKDFWETILAGRTWHGETINRRKDGSLYTEDQSVTPILDGSDAITHFVAIKEDITERLLLEAQFRQAQKMESVGQLASGIAHDFNNLLTVINGMSDLVLAQVSEDDPVHADVQEIYRAGERAAALTCQLLAFSRQQVLEPRVINLNTVVAGMESLLRRLLGEDIDLVVVLTPGLGHVKADPGQIEQVTTNLAVNARDAMPQGGHLTIETQNVTINEDDARRHVVAVPPGSYVLLALSDSGVGMDGDTRARIFEPFFTTKGPGKGSGLGLSTVYGIVNQSHGFIWVDSEVGHGASFKILLPQVTEAADTDRPAPTVVSSSGTETVLLVEDNAALRKLATRVLEPAGYTVLGAAEGEEALRLLEGHEEPVHLLLSDVVLPGMSGRELAERLAQARPGMKALYISGYTGDTIVRHGVLEAQVPFLNKPFTAAALLRKVREVLDAQA